MTPDVPHSAEARVQANGIELVYDTFGETTNPPMLLIMGLATQMIAWDEEFCAQLATRGYWVIRFDNRDIGLSTKFDEAGVPNILRLMSRAQQGKPIDAPYTLYDMAKDTTGLLDTLGIESAHIVGASMGGAIAQIIATCHPDRARTLTSIMSSTGDPAMPPPKTKAMAILTRRTPTHWKGYVKNYVKSWRVLHGDVTPFDEDRARRQAERNFERGLFPAGVNRQLAAILATGNRKEELKSVGVPTLVIHGDADPLVPVENGYDTADTIPGAKLVIVEGMGHDMPPANWPQIIDAITNHAV
jgi:pimeloyl-ACP methyl ester carboxylesterase